MKNSTATQLAPVDVSSPTEARNARSNPRANSAELRLVARLQAADESAFRTLVQRYHGSLMRFALVFLPNRALAEEAVQDTWTAVLDGMSSFQGRSSLKTWIFRILTNRAKTRLMREARSVPFSSLKESDLDEQPVDPARFSSSGRWAEPPQGWNDDSPERQLIDREAIRCVERALQELPPKQRAVVTLRDVEGLESDEVCHVLGVRETNQRVLLHRGRSKLRQALEEQVNPIARCG
jgi:RNA polymerase sigma-70 factor, ECF subfamily